MFTNGSLIYAPTEAPVETLNFIMVTNVAVTGEKIIQCFMRNCKTSSQDKKNVKGCYGDPKVDFKIWINRKEMGYSTGAQRVSLKLNNSFTLRDDDNITCGLTGEALNCLDVNKPSRRRITNNVKGMFIVIKVKTEMTVKELLYIVETIIAVMLLLWTVYISLRHVGIVIRLQRRKVERKLVALEERRWHLDD
ncbi:hypothetical protein BgiBS90_013503 [Biomphalaria glabrata]|nr:hypothetical protein BgiBS90_013503 [Biomphalaria glabrata]